MKITNAAFEDLDDIVDLHIEAFPGFFLTTLGRDFLKELYGGFLSGSSGVFLVAREIGKREIVGFVAGTIDPENFFRNLRTQRGLYFILKAIPAILKNPRPVCKKLIYAVRYRGEIPVAKSKGALLSSIGVAKSAVGTGISGSLITAFEEEIIRCGVRSIYLTTDALNNDRVNAFYIKHGYVVLEKFFQNGKREMFRYEKVLSD